MEGIRRDDEATDKIVNDPAEPTFENTIARVDTDKGEHYYDLLSRVSNVFSCMMSAETCDEMEEIAQKMSPILTKHANDITLNSTMRFRSTRNSSSASSSFTIIQTEN